MKILLDEMYAGLRPFLLSNWLEVETVQLSLGPGADDESVIKYAQENDMVLVTGDCQMPRKSKKAGGKVILVSKEDLAMLVKTKLRALQTYLHYTRGEM